MAKILIAEDERDIRDLITFTLQFAGHNVVSVANGAEAVEKVPSVQPDLIIMDVRMPRMTGYEACRVLKAQDSTKHIPIVFVSAKGQEQEVQLGLEAGALDYILKPFVPDQLALRVKEILARARAETEQSTIPSDDTASPASASTEKESSSAAKASTASASTDKEKLTSPGAAKTSDTSASTAQESPGADTASPTSASTEKANPTSPSAHQENPPQKQKPG